MHLCFPGCLFYMCALSLLRFFFLRIFPTTLSKTFNWLTLQYSLWIGTSSKLVEIWNSSCHMALAGPVANSPRNVVSTIVIIKLLFSFELLLSEMYYSQDLYDLLCYQFGNVLPRVKNTVFKSHCSDIWTITLFSHLKLFVCESYFSYISWCIHPFQVTFF